jgi:hypothetical protein
MSPPLDTGAGEAAGVVGGDAVLVLSDKVASVAVCTAGVVVVVVWWDMIAGGCGFSEMLQRARGEFDPGE